MLSLAGPSPTCLDLRLPIDRSTILYIEHACYKTKENMQMPLSRYLSAKVRLV